MERTPLDAKIKAVNMANVCALKLYDQLAEALRPLVGQKIMKQDGDMMKKYAELIPKFKEDDIHVYRYSSNYSISWVAKSCVSHATDDESCQIANYHESYILTGFIRDGILTSISEKPDRRTDYKADEIISLRKRYDEVSEELQNIDMKLSPFGRYDR